MGPTLTTRDITVTTPLVDTLASMSLYKIFLLPMAIPIPFGMEDTAKGTIFKSTIDTLDTTIGGGAFWAQYIIHFNHIQLTAYSSAS